MDWEAQDEGVIARILAPDGAKDIPVGTIVAVVVEDADMVSIPEHPAALSIHWHLAGKVAARSKIAGTWVLGLKG